MSLFSSIRVDRPFARHQRCEWSSIATLTLAGVKESKLPRRYARCSLDNVGTWTIVERRVRRRMAANAVVWRSTSGQLEYGSVSDLS